LLCLPVDPRPLDPPLIRFGCVSGGLLQSSPFPSTSCAGELLESPIAPSSCCRGGCFISPTVKLTASLATEARGGISDGVGWLLWPLSDDLEAIGHGFGGRSTHWWVDCCVLCAKKYGTFVRTSQKNSSKTNQDPTSRSSLFSTAH
jgi:hypothetical protein